MNLPNDVTPDEAHRRYQNHLVDWYGSVVKSEFEQFKDEEWCVFCCMEIACDAR